MVVVLFQDGYTALHLAVLNCKPQVVQTLLGFGAKVDLQGGKVLKNIKILILCVPSFLVSISRCNNKNVLLLFF